MLAVVRKKIISGLWNDYIKSIHFYDKLFLEKPILDHLAIIDLTSWRSGRDVMRKIFSKVGFIESGNGYLPDKQNDFLWMREADFENLNFGESLPQLVLADFRNELFSPEVQNLIEKLTSNIKQFDFAHLDSLIKDIEHGDPFATEAIVNLVLDYFRQPAWPKPTKAEYDLLKNENNLLAWVALFGRKVNHFGVCVNNLKQYSSFQSFILKVKDMNLFSLNSNEGEIKGGTSDGICQASSIGAQTTIKLPGGQVVANESFMEFVWRFPVADQPKIWNDYFNGFVANNATYVIESLYQRNA